VVTRLVHDRITDVELTTGKGGGLSDLGVVVLDVFDGDIADELV
jgi:hypothetical protein